MIVSVKRKWTKHQKTATAVSVQAIREQRRKRDWIAPQSCRTTSRNCLEQFLFSRGTISVHLPSVILEPANQVFSNGMCLGSWRSSRRLHFESTPGIPFVTVMWTSPMQTGHLQPPTDCLLCSNSRSRLCHIRLSSSTPVPRECFKSRQGTRAILKK